MAKKELLDVNEGALRENDSPSGMNQSNLSLNAQVEFLGTELEGVFETSSSTDTSTKKTTKRTRFLVMPTDTDTQGIKLTEAISEINDLVKGFSGGADKPSINTDDVKKQMEQFGLSIFENITLNVRQAFLYQDKTTETAEGAAPVTVANTMEYAVNVDITNVLNLPEDFKLFNIKSIGLAIWKTANPKVLDRMKIADIDTLLH